MDNFFGRLKIIPDSKKNRAKILPASDSTEDNLLFDKLRMYFSRLNPAARFSPGIDPLLCPISLSGSVRLGFIPEIIKFVNHSDADVDIDESLLIKFKPGPVGNIPIIPNDKFKYRDYQEEAVNVALDAGRGIIVLPTGAGKSLVGFGIAYGMYEVMPKDHIILIIVPNLNLVEQFYKDFIEYGADDKTVFKFSASNKRNKPSRGQIIITNRDWLDGHKEELTTDVFAIIADECHTTASAKTTSGKFIEAQKTNFKIGLTATLNPADYEKFNVIGVLGPVLIEKEITILQKDGHIAPVDIIALKFKHIGFKEPRWDTYEDICNAYNTECSRIEESAANDAICKLASSMANKGMNVLILFDHTIHGKLMFDLITYPVKSFIDGGIKVDVREDVRGKTEEVSGSVIVAQSRCLSTGVNIKNLHVAILMMPGTASTKFLQSIGRFLRPHPSKEKAIIFDVHHNMKYSIRHFKERMKLYTNYYKIDQPTLKIIEVQFQKNS